jgi:hypothetical protein
MVAKQDSAAYAVDENPREGHMHLFVAQGMRREEVLAMPQAEYDEVFGMIIESLHPPAEPPLGHRRPQQAAPQARKAPLVAADPPGGVVGLLDLGEHPRPAAIHRPRTAAPPVQRDHRSPENEPAKKEQQEATHAAPPERPRTAAIPTEEEQMAWAMASAARMRACGQVAVAGPEPARVAAVPKPAGPQPDQAGVRGRAVKARWVPEVQWQRAHGGAHAPLFGGRKR